jgi:hypothetical protein
MATTEEKKGLSNDDILALLSKGRERNAYGPPLLEFCNSSEAAISVRDYWPKFKHKTASTLYQGFNTAINNASLKDTVDVKKVEDNVYLLHKERVALALESQD